jgi:anaerobic ribonucleoside-triphosphate reductase activating protein
VSLRVNAAARVAATRAEGPGLRAALWVQGCPLRCDGCCNPRMIPFRPAEPVTVAALVAELARTPGLDGVTLLGGEPFAQALPLARYAEAARALGLSVIAFSGYRLEELRALPGTGPRALLAATDLLVDGRFEAERASAARRNVGSDNQRLLALGPRGDELVRRWHEGPDVVEVRLRADGIFANGAAPDVAAVARACT